ncbi:SpaA isopeptide-forming pilin-related protein [Streptomyces sp. NPDC050095]|uniref:SpaA isopeptide-forming pilin-related protein n=1 Tax=unclassified Streptomyces TaxID=2593676 RepID=UPI003414982B
MREVDADGAWDQVLEPGLPGVRVTLRDDAGRTVSAVTGSDGVAVFTPSTSALTGGKYRIAVSNPDPDTLTPAIAGLGSGADVVRSNTGFVDVGGGTDATYTTGFWEPDTYCQENPRLVTCGLARGDATGEKGLVSFGSELGTTHPGGPLEDLTENQEQGAVFGVGTDRDGNVFTGTYVKRHTEYGPAGPVNAVYRYNATSDAVTTFTTLPGALTAHEPGPTDPHYISDDAVYGRVGREGLGDVDVSGDGKTLYAVDLNDSTLYTVPVNGSGDGVTAGAPVAHPIPKPTANCAGQWHPFGIGVRGKRVLVGGVCGAENTVTASAPYGDPAQLRAHVLTFTGSGFTPLFDTALNFERGCVYRFLGSPASAYRCDDSTTVGEVMSADWEAWNERVPGMESHGFVSAPQPMLSNIEIADNGDLVLGFRDRFADMQGQAAEQFGGSTFVNAVAAGDVLRACATGGGFALESNGTCGALTGAVPGNRQGPGGGEFYDDDVTLWDAKHEQTGQGGTVLQPYSGKLWGTSFDPFDGNAYEQGVRQWDSENGSRTGSLSIHTTDFSNTRFGKGNGLADLELICDKAPVQVGNRTWFDTDRDGIQDPGEPDLPGVKVTLTPKGGGTPITVTTDANGEYYVGTAQGLRPDTAYDMVFDYSGVDTSTLPGSPDLEDLRWTKQKAGSDRTIDSNVDTDGNTSVSVGPAGYVNHTIDAGINAPRAKLTVAKTDKVTHKPLAGAAFEVWRETNGQPGLQTSGATPDTRAGAVCRTGANGRCVFQELSFGTYYVKETAVPAGYVLPRSTVVGPYTLTSANAVAGDGKLVSLSNAPDLRLTLLKKDGKTGRPLPGAVFELWRETNGKPGLQTSGSAKDTRHGPGCATDRRGRCTFRGLPPGTYYLRETATPEGYVAPRRPVSGPYRLTSGGAATSDGKVVTLTNKRGEPCKGKKC